MYDILKAGSSEKLKKKVNHACELGGQVINGFGISIEDGHPMFYQPMYIPEHLTIDVVNLGDDDVGTEPEIN